MNPVKLLSNYIDGFWNMLLLRYRGVECNGRICINGRLKIPYGGRRVNIHIGEGVVINSSISSNPTGGANSHTILAVLNGGRISIGDNAGISNATIVSKQYVEIGNNVSIGVDCLIYDTDMHSVDYNARKEYPDQHIKSAPVVIGDGAWLCGRCIVLKGVHIGKRSVIAAGSVVTHDVPDDELWGGNPCEFIKKINNGYCEYKNV